MTGIEFMHHLFGSGHPSDKCGTCKHLKSYTASRKWYKCECYGLTNSEATDWRKKHPSCALYNMPYKGKPGIEIKKHMKRVSTNPLDNYECEGQMSIEDYLQEG